MLKLKGITNGVNHTK